MTMLIINCQIKLTHSDLAAFYLHVHGFSGSVKISGQLPLYFLLLFSLVQIIPLKNKLVSKVAVLARTPSFIIIVLFSSNINDPSWIIWGAMCSSECWWNQWRFWGIDGNKVWSLGFLKRRRGVRDSFPRRKTTAHPMELDSRWVKEAVHRSWASLELAQVRPTWWVGRPRLGPSGPQLARVNRWGQVFKR